MRSIIHAEDLKKELTSRRIKYLFHATTVETSITFLRYGHLFTRGHCENEGYPQLPQWNDEADKKHGIWNDLLLTFHDSHQAQARPNVNGPILFCINSEKLFNHIKENKISVSLTLKQSSTWKENDTDSDRWRNSVAGLFPHEKTTEIALSNLEMGLPLELVDRIIIDNHPGSETFASQVQSIAENCVKGHDLHAGIAIRNSCQAKCKCKDMAYLESKHLEEKYEIGGWSDKYGKIA